MDAYVQILLIRKRHNCKCIEARSSTLTLRFRMSGQVVMRPEQMMEWGQVGKDQIEQK